MADVTPIVGKMRRALRKRLLPLSLTLLAGLGLMAGGAGFAPRAAMADDGTVELLVFERAPYYELDPTGGVRGLVATPVAQAFKDANIPYVWRVVPPGQHLRIVGENRERVCAVGWFRTAERESLGRFTESVYQDRPLSILVRSDNDQALQYAKVGDLLRDRALTFGRKLGFSYGEDLDQALADANPNAFTTAQDGVGMIRMLIGRRFDYMFAAPEEAENLLGLVGVVSDDVAIVNLEDMPPANKRYLLCSNSVGKAEIERLNVAIRRTGS